MASSARSTSSVHSTKHRLAVFVFPGAAGHVNPSLPICRRLVDLGWQVVYVCNPSFKSVIEETGAEFRDTNAVCESFGGISDLREMIMQSMEEYQDPGAKMWALNFGSIATERLIPIFADFFKELSPKLLVYCPVLCPYAHFAASLTKLRSVSLLTAAGPGYWDAAFKVHGGTAQQLAESIAKNEANQAAVEKIRVKLGQPRMSLNTSEPLVQDYYAQMNLVTTLPSLADPLSEKDAGVYFAQGKKFEFVGPLLEAAFEGATSAEDMSKLFEEIGDATEAGREIVYVSMGTVVTGNHEEYGWKGCSGTVLTGKQISQAVYGAVFKELGEEDGKSSPLVILSVGPQDDALVPDPPSLWPESGVPKNCLCLPRVPQVDLLQRVRSQLAFCVTNGGQNTFMESLSVGAPLLVCPGFGDQLSNAARADALKLGVKVDRPKTGDASEALEAYHASVCSAIQVMKGTSSETFRAKARGLAEEVRYAGGLPRAVDLILESL